MKKHWLLAALAALVICVLCFTLFPTEAKAATDGWLTYEIVDGEAIITDCDNTATGSIEIPSTLGGYPVTTIGEFAFAHLTNPLSVNTGNGVTTISDAAFLGCTGLEQIALGHSVSSIGTLAFEACDNLQSFVVSDNNTNYSCIDGILFNKNATVLVCAPKTISGEYTVPAGVLTVGEYAFDGCMYLTDLIISDDVTTISGRAFNNCMNLKTVKLGNSVAIIGNYAFCNCSRISKLVVPVSVSNINDNAFYRCTGLADVHYVGTESQWRDITIGSNNETLDAATMHYESDGSAPPDPWYLSYEIIDGGAVITACDTFIEGNLELPATLGGYPITGIGNNAFRFCQITDITLPETLETIGNNAFCGTALRGIYIPSGVHTIGQVAFQECSDFNGFVVAQDNPYFSSDGYGILFNKPQTKLISAPCALLGTYTIPSTVTTVGYSAFFGCSQLAQLDIPASVTNMDFDAGIFKDCTSLSTIIVDPANPSYYADAESVLYSKDGSNIYYAPKTISGDYIVPEGVTSLNNAFEYCSDLTGLYFPESLTNIDSQFWSCNLKKVYIPATATIFNFNLHPLEESQAMVLYAGTREQWDAIHMLDNNKHPQYLNLLYNCTPIMWDLSWNIYEDGAYITGCSEYATGSITVPDTLGGYPVVGIDPWAFQSCTDITEVHLPDSVTSIGINAFAYCTNLKTVTMSNNVTAIGNGAFSSCTSLSDIQLSKKIGTIEEFTFYGCTSLSEITIPNNVAVIGPSAFYGCTNLRQLVIPGSVTMIEKAAFMDCTGLTNVTLCNGVTSLGESAFSRCTNLESISLPNSLTSIGSYAFKECSWLKSIIIPDSVTEVGAHVFEYCSNLKTAVIGSGLCRIPNGMFWANTSLKEITIPATVTDIDLDVFYFCDNLTDVYYRGTQAQKLNITIEDPIIAAATWHCESCIGTADHSFMPTVVKATFATDGSITQKCETCGADGPTSIIHRVDVCGILGQSIIADGTTKKPSVAVKDAQGNLLIEGTDYTVRYPSNAVEAGDYEVTITLKGKYSGQKILHFVIEPAAKIATQPKTAKVKVGATAKFTVKATGVGLKYQWQSSADGKTWKNCSSSTAKKATFTFTSKTSHSSNYYRCVITDSDGNKVYTDAVRLYVLSVTTQPKTQKVEAGEKVKFTVKATGAGKTYQWQVSTDGKTWKNCSSSSATSATFTFTAKTSHSSNYYRCRIKDNAGNTVYTDAVRLYVLGITEQPVSKTVTKGKTAKFVVEATGAGKTYQWQCSTDGGKTWKNCSSSSARKATFTFTSKTTHNGNYYRCRVKDNGGNTVYTTKVKLTVKR